MMCGRARWVCTLRLIIPHYWVKVILPNLSNALQMINISNLAENIQFCPLCRKDKPIPVIHQTIHPLASYTFFTCKWWSAFSWIPKREPLQIFMVLSVQFSCLSVLSFTLQLTCSPGTLSYVLQPRDLPWLWFCTSSLCCGQEPLSVQ